MFNVFIANYCLQEHCFSMHPLQPVCTVTVHIFHSVTGNIYIKLLLNLPNRNTQTLTNQLSTSASF